MNTIDRSSSTLDRDAASLRIHAFPKGHDLWRIDWFGTIASPDRMARRRHPSVLVYLSKVVANDALENPAALLQPAATLPAHHQTKCWVSVGTTILLRIGDLWQNQTLVARPSYEEVTFEDIQIDREHVTLIKAGLSVDDGAFMLPLSEHPWHLNNTHSYCVSVALPDKRWLVVPCMEMVRFYFGSSSALLSKLFSPPLTKDQLFEDVKRSRFGHMSLKLAPGIPRASAEDIARMAANRDAWHAATLISTSCLRTSVAGQDIYPQAIFPFEGTTTLQVSGKWLSLGDESNKTFLAYQLHSCSHPFPFRSLFASYYGRVRPHLGTSGPSAAHHSTESTIRSRAATEARSPRLRERDPSTQLSRATGTVSTRRRFPDLEFKAISSLSVHSEPAMPQAALYSHSSSVDDLAVGKSGSIQRIRPIDLVEQRYRKHPDPPAYLQHVISALDALQAKGYSVHTLTASDEDGWTVPISAEMAADPEDGVIDDLLIVSEEGNRLRRIAVFQLSKNDRHHVLGIVEFDPLMPTFSEIRTDRIDDLFNLLANMAFLFAFHIQDGYEQGFGFDSISKDTSVLLENWLLRLME